MASLSEENYNPEEYLLNTLNDLDIGFVKVSNNGIILNHNLTFNKIFGYDPKKDLIGTKSLDYWLNPEERNKFREILFKNGIVKKYIAPAKKVDGDKIFLEITIKLNKNSQGEIISSEGTFTDMTERIEAEKELKRIEWLLETKPKQEQITIPEYGDLTELNEQNLILDMVGKKVLYDIVINYLDLLETSAAVYEKNGDYVLGIFTSGYCKFLDKASRKLCDTDDNLIALNCGNWHCHESCWSKTSKKSIELGKSFENECDGGLHIFATPIWVRNEIVGSINIGYGDPPSDDIKLQEIAEKYYVNVDELKEISNSYESRPIWITDIAKNKLLTSAKLIGEIIERKMIEQKLIESEEKFRLAFENASDAIIWADPTTQEIINCNIVAEKILERDKSEIIGHSITILHPPKDSEFHEEQFQYQRK